MSGPLSRADYPGLDPSEFGRMPNAGYGKLDGVDCHPVEAGAAMVLASAVLVADTDIMLLDASALPGAPFTLQAGPEQMRVTSVSGSTLTVSRGYNGTRAYAHPASRTLYEVRTSYVYLVADHPVASLDAVYVDGSRLLEGYTAHTGQAGDELAGYEGRAVLSLAAAPYVGRQYNLKRTEAALRAEGVEATSAAVSWSAREPVDGLLNTFAIVGGPEGRPVVWASFGPPGGLCLAHSYSAVVENSNPSGNEVRVLVGVRRGGVMLQRAEHLLSPGERKAISLWRTALGGAEEGDELIVSTLALEPGADGLKVYSLSKTIYMDDSLMPEPLLTLTIPPSGALSGRGWSRLSARGSSVRRTAYPAGPDGTVDSATHRVMLTEASGTEKALVRLAAQGDGGERFIEARIEPGASETLSLKTDGGQWEGETALVALEGDVSVEAMEKTLAYYPASSGPARETAKSSSARVVVGDRVSVDAGFTVDTDGSFGGIGTLIERPDHVMRHFLIEHMGFDAADIEATSFEEAGILYASAITGGYRMSFLLNHARELSDTLTSMARQARSVIRFGEGKWRLGFLPDIAPDAVKAIRAEELAPGVHKEGGRFVFNKKPLYELANTLTARFGPDLAGRGRWSGTLTASDGTSIAKYGGHGATLEMDLIRHEATAESVLTHMLLESSTPLMSVTFTVFYEHFDLSVGDTIEIDNPLYGGRKFFIERISRLDQSRAEIEALEWWG